MSQSPTGRLLALDSITLYVAHVAVIVAAGTGHVFAAPLLPDLIAWESGPPTNYMHDGSMDLTTIANKVLYRYSQPIANIGDGPLELSEDTDSNFVQTIHQWIYDSEGGADPVYVGTFPNAHPPYGHLFLVGIAEYRIRTVTSGNGVGPVVASQIKTSYGLYDSDDYNTALPGAPDSFHYTSNTPCLGESDQCLGISVGWADVYPSYFAGQYIDVTGVPDGQYWLEAEIDPDHLLQESDETNNITRVLVNLVVPEPTIKPGDYNQDDVVNAADHVVWRKMLGQSVPRGTSADGDGNGVIGMPDLDVWQGEFGESAPGGGSSPVPEPSTILMLLSVCACRPWRRQRRSYLSG
jgi:hypothetical protein